MKTGSFGGAGLGAGGGFESGLGLGRFDDLSLLSIARCFNRNKRSVYGARYVEFHLQMDIVFLVSVRSVKK